MKTINKSIAKTIHSKLTLYNIGMFISKQKIFPRTIIYNLWILFSKRKISRAKKTFKQSIEIPIWLERDALEKLQQKYPCPPEYKYDPQSLEKRGEERARELLNLNPIKIDHDITTFLELGCWDGMASCALQKIGKKTTAIDYRSKGFDERALKQGVTLLQMDATNLQFENESFDFVFSYDVFEHLADPELVLQEAIRVVKPGGYIYLDFGPLYMSPMGLHAYNSIYVPYCQFLFQNSLLNDFANENGLESIDFDQVNGWSLDDYRKLWNSHPQILEKTMYCEEHNLFHLNLIMKYPSCFKSKTKNFDDLLVSKIKVLFKKN